MPTNSAPRRLPLAVTALCLVQFMDVLGVTVVVTALPLCAAAAGAGIGLSSIAATGLGPRWRGGASGIVNTAAQLGTAAGVAVLLMIAAATSGVPAAGTAPPRVAWAVGAVVAAAGAARFAASGRPDREVLR
jgi:hypothetical protein